MLTNFIIWLIVFGLSFLVQNLGWADQGTAFVWIYLGAIGILIIVLMLIVLIVGKDAFDILRRGSLERFRISSMIAIIYLVNLVIVLFATWCATQLIHVDFAVAFELMTFGQCLSTDSKKGKE